MKLVKGEPKDAKDLKKIHVSAYQTSYRGYIPDDYLDSMTASDEVVLRTAAFIEKTETYFVEENGEKVGFVYLDYPKEQGDAFEIMAIYVHPDCQLKGVGRFVVNELSKMKKLAGFTKVIAWTMKEGPSIGFYQKMGFKQVEGEKKFWKFDIPIICFEKEI